MLSFEQVNDDICDCPDGSDEPGTAACPNNYFYCQNVGHIPGKLASSRVNDGVCDYDVCCDGSDEQGLSSSNPTAPKCENKCKEINARYVAELKKNAALQEAGLKVRDQIVAKAKKLRDALEVDLRMLQGKLVNLEEQLKQNEEKLATLSANIKVETEQPKEISKAKEDVEGLEKQYSSALEVIQKLQQNIETYELILQTMKTEYNPNFNDPAVKAAIRSFEEIQANPDATLDQTTNQLKQDKSKFASVMSDLGAFKVPTCNPASKSFLPAFFQNQLMSLKLWMIENGLLADTSFDPLGSTSSSTDGDSVELTYLRNMITKQNTELGKLRTQIQDLKTDISTNYGRDEVLRGLKNVCVSNLLGEYTYEFCFSGQASQKGNGQSTNLGTFESLNYSEDGKTLTLNYEKGAKCWSGPIRRASIEITCGSQDEILLVSEPERCEYFFKVSSPIACAKVEVPGTEGAVRDEL